MLPKALRRAGAGALAAVVAATLCAAALPQSAAPAHAQDDPSVSEGASPAPEPTATGTPTPTPTPTAAPTPTPEPTETPAPEETATPAPEETAPAETPAPEQTPDTPEPAEIPAEEAPAPVAGTDGNAGAHWPLVITEIQGDNPGADEYEFLEVTNTTDQPIDLEATGIQVRYHTSMWNAGTVQPLIHLEGEADAPAVIPAGGVAVLWMNYAEGDPRRALTKDQFREFYGLTDAAAPIFRFGPQGGFANSGNRGFSLTDAAGTTLSRAWVPADDGNASTPWNAQFAVPDLIGSADARILQHDVTGATATPTPGAITVEQVTSALTKPTDPDSDGPLLQITEVAPDTANISGSDAYEYIELYNASDKPIDFGDYVLAYLTTDNDLTNPKALSSTLWPAGPGEPTIASGETLVLWIQNPAVVAAGLTVADFNAAMGSDLKLGESILTISSGGMANGGSRGLQLQTKSGHVVSRAFYFDDAQTTASTAIQDAWNPAGAAAMWTPADPAGTTQAMLGLAAPTPGAVSDAQVAPAFVAYPPAGAAPKIVDLTGGSEVPDSENIELGFDITDDVLVRRVTLTLTDSLGGVEERNLTFATAGRYLYSIPAVDVYGKRWVEYSVTAGDGSLESTLGPVRIVLDDSPVEPVRLNVADGQYVNAQTPIVGTTDGDPGALSIGVDGTALGETAPSLERAPKFAIEATSTDSFFRNGLKFGDDVLKIFDEGYYDRIVTVDADVPVDQVVRGDKLTLGVYAGTKAWPEPNVDENNDDFTMMNPRLVLPDGRVLHPTTCAGAGEGKDPVERACPADAAERIALSDANLVYILFTFDIPEDAFDSVSATWDTTAVADGDHVVTASEGERTATRTVKVDNTAPRIDTTLTDGTQYRGDFTIDATVTDEGSGYESVTATLDEKEIALPLKTSSLTLAPGDHTAVITAKDKVGNSSTSTIAFSTADEKPHTTLISPDDGARIDADEVDLVASPGSNVDDRLELCFAEGYRYVPTDAAVRVASGTTTDSRSSDRGDARTLSADELAKLTRMDGIEVAETSETAMPYQLFTVDVPANAKDGSDARVAWEGSANADAKVLLYVQDVKGGWQEVDRHVTTGGAPTSFTLEAQVPVADHAKDGKITFLVQHSEGWAATDLSGRDSQVTPYNEGATPRDQYDFTLAWESDTQYYNSNEGRRAGTGGSDAWYTHQLNINRFLVDQRDELNLQYVAHTGDIVDNQNEEYQWQNADDAYRMLDEAGMPYGVLAGNHDVGHFEGNYGPYSSYFGEDRFAENPWYGGSYKDNRGHYDLVSAGGVDLLVMYMGWPDPNDTASNSEDIAWMNSVIRQYPERKVMLNLHEFMLTTGGLGPFPQRIYDEVVAPNANVIAVGSGHYHDAYTRLDEFDDDGDGVADRTVTSMLFDYQALPEGGMGYLRLLHFDNGNGDNENGRIIVRTYSPSLDDFDSDEPSLNSPAGMQEFEIPYAAGGIRSVAKTLSTDSFRADILTTNEIDCVKDVVSGEETSVTWKGVGPAKGKARAALAAAAPAAEHGWYVRTTGPYGGVEYSEVRMFTATGKTTGPTDPTGPGDGGGENGGGNGNGGGDGNGGNGSGGPQGSGSGQSGELATTGGSALWPIGLGIGALLTVAAGGILIARGRRDRRIG
ncbi:cell wall protein [Microbacterium bovistercoris]|uniref:Cell wall protein n=1 Tax=Microbacterium bovistercoris TaxID=2293570 RepID=A0A371NUS5_9MICO|nr:lamin tail domain-containing protein [Microbacterium bovistercoris]REJ06201.1 cell wall protein [Microbacterium bovistercoris]